MRKRTLVSGGMAALVAAAVLSVSAGPAHAGGCEAAAGFGDARIRKGNGNYHGAGVFNCLGNDQYVFKVVLRGQKLVSDFRVKNDGNGPTGITMNANLPSPEHFKVKILKANGKDVTEKVDSGDFKFQGVAEGASTPRLQVIIKARNTALDGISAVVYAWGVLGDNPGITGDTVRAAVELPT